MLPLNFSDNNTCMATLGRLVSPLQPLHIFYLILTSVAFNWEPFYGDFFLIDKNNDQSVSKISLKMCDIYKVNKSN